MIVRGLGVRARALCANAASFLSVLQSGDEQCSAPTRQWPQESAPALVAFFLSVVVVCTGCAGPLAIGPPARGRAHPPPRRYVNVTLSRDVDRH